MAHKSILGAEGGILKTIVTEDTDPDRVVFVSEQDLDATFKSVALKREQAMSSDFKPVAEIPGVIVEEMMRNGSWNDPAAIKKWLNDTQNECFRIWRGKV
jgi:hypothetical protein